MANIPGINGFVQPGTFARDRVISRGVSIPGGTRIACIMGEGLREETIVESAVGSGLDGNAACAPDGDPAGRFFKLQNTSIVSGRTELYLNGTLLRGLEDEIDASGFDTNYDYRVDTSTGCIELQSARIEDQDGKLYSASSLNVGNGIIVSGTCGTSDLLSIQDANAPGETWTARCVGVVRDSNGDPVPGRATFTLTGTVSGQLRDSNGQPILFTSGYKTGTLGAVSGSEDPADDGFIVADDSGFAVGSAVTKVGDATPLTTNQFEFSGDLVTQGQALVGDLLVVDGYADSAIEITDIEYDSGTDKTTLTLETDSLSTGIEDTGWSILASDLFVDDPTVLHNATTGIPATAGEFTSADIGKVLAICSGTSQGFYTITAVTSSRRVRLGPLDASSSGLPALAQDFDGVDSDGLAETGLTWHLLQTNGVLQFGIQEGSIPFQVGDKFLINISSRVLAENDTLEARYIATTDLEDPELFVSAQELFQKHGRESTTNTLSLGAQLAFENGAPAVLALQCKPPLPRRTSETLLIEEDSNGDGGFAACGGNADDCESDDLLFPIPPPLLGLRSGRPDGDTQVNVFVIRNNVETQIFPNKFPFYASALQSETARNNWVNDPDNSFSYTIVNTGNQITDQGYNGAITASTKRFSTAEIDFDAGIDDGFHKIVIQSVEVSGTTYTTDADIVTQLGLSGSDPELTINSVVDDNTVTFSEAITADGADIQFFIKDESDTTNVRAALLLHSDLVDNGTLQSGDGIRISYIDESDADFFDTNWFQALEELEAFDCNMVVPLPLQNRNGIFQAAVKHCQTMSSIAIQKERIAMFGAQQGLTTNALLGLEEVAIEDVGVLEGLQGDDPEEALAGNTEDLVNYKLSDSFTSNRSVYMYPDQIVRTIQGTNTFIDGFYMAAAAAGFFSATQNLAVPLTNKILTGFTILRSKQFRPTIRNSIGNIGATLVQPAVGGGQVLAGRTTSNSGFIEDEEISVVFIRDRVKEVLRESLRGFIGTPENPNTQGILTSRVNSIMSGLVSQELVTQYGNIRVQRDKVDPRQWNVYLRFTPSFPINFVFIDIEVGVS